MMNDDVLTVNRLGHITSAHGVSTFRARFAKSNSPLYMSHRQPSSIGDLYCILYSKINVRNLWKNFVYSYTLNCYLLSQY